MPTFWYILRDSNPENKMKFVITDKGNLQKSLFDLSCPAQSGSGFDSGTTVASSGRPDIDSIRGRRCPAQSITCLVRWRCALGYSLCTLILFSSRAGQVLEPAYTNSREDAKNAMWMT